MPQPRAAAPGPPSGSRSSPAGTARSSRAVPGRGPRTPAPAQRRGPAGSPPAPLPRARLDNVSSLPSAPGSPPRCRPVTWQGSARPARPPPPRRRPVFVAAGAEEPRFPRCTYRSRGHVSGGGAEGRRGAAAGPGGGAAGPLCEGRRGALRSASLPGVNPCLRRERPHRLPRGWGGGVPVRRGRRGAAPCCGQSRLREGVFLPPRCGGRWGSGDPPPGAARPARSAGSASPSVPRRPPGRSRASPAKGGGWAWVFILFGARVSPEHCQLPRWKCSGHVSYLCRHRAVSSTQVPGHRAPQIYLLVHVSQHWLCFTVLAGPGR